MKKQPMFSDPRKDFEELVDLAQYYLQLGKTPDALSLAEQAMRKEPAVCQLLRKRGKDRVDKVSFTGTALICEYAPAVLDHALLARAEDFVKQNKSTYRHSVVKLADQFRLAHHRLQLAYRLWRDLQKTSSQQAVLNAFDRHDLPYVRTCWDTWTQLGYIRSRGPGQDGACIWRAKLNEQGRILCRHCGVVVRWSLTDYLAESLCPQCDHPQWSVWLDPV
ncbi:MAG: hypothetical protein ACKOGA_01850 [Planctomycetaceae bacterium]